MAYGVKLRQFNLKSELHASQEMRSLKTYCFKVSAYINERKNTNVQFSLLALQYLDRFSRETSHFFFCFSFCLSRGPLVLIFFGLGFPTPLTFTTFCLLFETIFRMTVSFFSSVDVNKITSIWHSTSRNLDLDIMF
jgi:hypothetical protein